MCADGEARIEHENATFGPGREQSSVFGRRDEGRVVLLEGRVHVLEGGWSGRGRAHREAEAVGLVVVVVGVLAYDDALDRVEGRIAGPTFMILISTALLIDSFK